MPLLIKDGKLASIGGALKRFIAGCLDACCGKWYCHLPDYTCDQNDFDYISEHSSRVACLQACGDGVEHYCHVGGSCDTDPTDAVATYPSKKDCEAACGQWWCCYESLDYTKGSECREGPCDLPELIRAGPFDSKQDCEPDCEMQYYCVLVDGTDGSQSDHYMCVTDPAGMTVLAGPQSEAECDATCYSRRPTIWCVDKKRCVLSFDGPPVECSFGVFCEEHPNFIDCGLNCLEEKWYCIPADNQCMQLALPPTPDAQPYGSQGECEKECQSYYCCWVSQGDPTKGSYCQIGECDPGFEKSGPHDDQGICEADCHSIYCWSYYDTATSETVKTCAEDPPLGDCEPNYGCEGSQEVDGDAESENLMISYRSDGFDAERTNIGGTLWRVDYRCQRQTAECDVNICVGPLRPEICSHENVTQVSGPYGRVTDCERICNPPVYKWFCENDVCVKCCASGTCAPADRSCPASGNFSTEEDCKGSCGSPCYFCEDGTVTEDHLPPDECTGLGGFLDKTDADEDCKPPQECCAVCEEPLNGGLCPPGFEEQGGKCVKAITYGCEPDVFALIILDYPECQSGFQSLNGPCPPPPPIQLWCCDGGAEGYFCGERVNVPGVGEMIGDAPIGTCTSVKKVNDCSECGLPPPNPCTGYGEYMWTGTAWELDYTNCMPSGDCRPAPPPTQPGDFVGELKQVDCQPRVNSANNPLP